MIRPDGYVKVLDFGLAKLTAATWQTSSGNFELSQHTTPGMIMGTAAYMSPEQAQGTEVDARTDIWALGVILYEMAAGKLPFYGPTPSHTIVAILEHTPLPFEHPSAELRQIISTALQKDKQLRFQTAESMASALDELKHRLGYISDQSISGPVNVDDRKTGAPKQSGGSSKLLWLVPAIFAVLVVGVLAVGGALVLFSDSSGAASNTVKGNSAVPAPSATASAVTVSPTPVTVANSAIVVPTPESIYVDPTPVPIAQQRKAVQPTPEKPKIIAAEPAVRTQKPVEVKKKKPAQEQDPNCVFTNSCN
jgi:serine/threonine protein kinase